MLILMQEWLMMEKLKKTVQTSAKKLSIAPAKVEYDTDFFKWTKTQSTLLKKGNLSKLDVTNLIEEIESLGRNDKRALRSYLAILLQHLLKKKFQPEKQIDSNSWNAIIINTSREIEFLIEDSPSLKKELIKMYPQAYERAIQDAAIETGLDKKKFPKECPWSLEEVLPFIKKKKT